MPGPSAGQSRTEALAPAGTSPLYVFAAIFEEQPTEEDLVGSVSLIVWTLTAILVVKYALIVLLADDNGQGGTFALYSLLKRAGQYRSRAGDLQLTRSAAAPLLQWTWDERGQAPLAALAMF